MDIKGTTRVCGLIGNPVGHSVSPAIHNNLARLTGKDMVYTTFKVEKGDVASAVRGAYSLNILGLNVTVPHKSEVIDSLVDMDPLAKAIGAVNTLVRVDGGFKGYNTDILGHAGYAEEGSDIICSAISVLTINTINSIEQFTDAVYDMSVDDEEASIDYIVTSNISDTTQVLLDALELGLRTMAADNPDYLLITVKEV